MRESGNSDHQQVSGDRGAPAIRAAVRSDALSTRLHGRALLAARAAWLAVAALTLAFFAVGSMLATHQLSMVCNGASCSTGQLSAADLKALHDLHLSVSFYVVHSVAIEVLIAAGYGAVAAVIFWRRSDDWLALFVSLALLTFGTATFGVMVAVVRDTLPGLSLPATVLIFLGSASFGLFLLIFPDGRFMPRWIAWFGLGWIVFQLLWYFVPPALPRPAYGLSLWQLLAGFSLWVLFIGAMVAAQIYRYRHVSTDAQRQQTKWVVYGITVALLGYLGGAIALALFAPGTETAPGALAILLGKTFMYLCMLLIPVTIAIAMLHYHLFDIDLIISQTFVYGSLAGILALIYQAALVSLQTLFLAVTGQTSFVANVLSTVLIGALFEPLRRRLKLVAGRFIRRPQSQLTIS